jgi:hypothetical protein
MSLLLHAIKTADLEQLSLRSGRLGPITEILMTNRQVPVLRCRPKVEPVSKKGTKANSFADGSNISKP